MSPALRIHPPRASVMATTIYLSSTYEDLQDYRRAVFELLRKSDYRVIAMEDYVATDQRPVDKCLKDVEESSSRTWDSSPFAMGMCRLSSIEFQWGFRSPNWSFGGQKRSANTASRLWRKTPTAWPRVFDDAYTSEDKASASKRCANTCSRRRRPVCFHSRTSLPALWSRQSRNTPRIIRNQKHRMPRDQRVRQPSRGTSTKKVRPIPACCISHASTRRYFLDATRRCAKFLTAV